MEGNMVALIGVMALIIVVISIVMFIFSRFRTCPSDRIMVIYGKVGSNVDGTSLSAKCIHGGASFVWPVIQQYAYMDLTPISISVDLKNALSKQNIRIDVPSRFTVGISTEQGVMQNAAERLLGLTLMDIQDLAKDIIFGQLRLVIATMDIEEINTDRDKFLEAVSRNVETELKKIGLRLINVNLTDITDESGYITALGKEAAAKAINDAKVSVAEADRSGSIGEAHARRDQRIQVSYADSEAIAGENEAQAKIAESNSVLEQRQKEAAAKAINDAKIAIAEADKQGAIGEAHAQRDQRIKVSLADSEAITGENEAQAKVAESESELRQRQAEARRRAIAAEKILAAKALNEAYSAEQEAELARAAKEQATLQADVIVKAEIQKRELEIQAEAQAEQIRRKARGEADAIYARMEAEARGVQEMLTKQATGLAQIVAAAGGSSTDAMRLMIADKIENLVATQVEAIKNIKIDKVTVWDNGNGANGSTSTANFLSGMMKSVPPLSEVFNLAGMELPEILGHKKGEAKDMPLGVVSQKPGMKVSEEDLLGQFALKPGENVGKNLKK